MSKLTENQKIEICTLYSAGLGCTNLANQFGVHENSILKLLKFRNIPIRTRKQASDFNDAVLRLYQEKLSYDDISKKLNLSLVTVRKILKENNVYVKGTTRKYEINENFFEIIDTEEKAYFLGFLFADGYNSKNNKTITISLNIRDKEILDKFCKLIYLDGLDHVHIYDRTAESKGVFATLNIHSVKMVKDLNNCGMVNAKTHILEYPKWMPEELHQHFIRGYFDGDGSIYTTLEKGRSCCAKLTSTNNFIKEIKNLIKEKLNLHMYIRLEKNEIYTGSYSGNNVVKKFLDWIYMDSAIYLKRKYEKYQEFLQIAEKVRNR